LPVETLSPGFWTMVEDRIAAVAAQRVPGVEHIRVRLFRMDGEALGIANRRWAHNLP
jgi:hypothetical protein